jgi:hypothetical protein
MAEHELSGIARELYAESRTRAKSIAESMPWPDSVAGTRTVPYAEEVRMMRELALADPTYLQRKLDEEAPKVIQAPNGQMYRPIQGMVRFQKLVKDALPEVWAVHAIQEG